MDWINCLYRLEVPVRLSKLLESDSSLTVAKSRSLYADFRRRASPSFDLPYRPFESYLIPQQLRTAAEAHTTS